MSTPLLKLATGQPEKNRRNLERAARLKHNHDFDDSTRASQRNALLIVLVGLFLISSVADWAPVTTDKIVKVTK